MESGTSPLVQVAPSDLRVIRGLYDRGLYVQAYRQAEVHGPLRLWSGTDARLIAGRLVGNLGASRLGRAMHYLAWRGDPAHPEAIYYRCHELVRSRGPLAAWEFQETHGDLSDASPAIRADFLALRAHTLGMLRDFDAAEQWMTRAENLAPDRPWIRTERACLLQMEDRYEDALSAARESLQLRPWYRPAVEVMSELLELLGRDEEALAMLTEAAEQLESPSVLLCLARLLNELGRYDEALAALDRACELALLREKGFTDWVAGRRSDVAYVSSALGQLARLAQPGRAFVGEAIGEHLLEQNRENSRIQLPVPFVRQHHQTCLPATLTAISRYWGCDIDHLELAGEICYDGTPLHDARAWFERKGWIVREFLPRWEDAVALIDRGVPFAVSWSAPGSAHATAVIGYDNHRRTWLLRDPSFRHTIEISVPDGEWPDGLTRPEGIVLVPGDKSAVLHGLELTDQGLHDQFYRIQLALKEHCRAEAFRTCEDMEGAVPGHRLCYKARLSLAAYDGDQTANLQCVEAFLSRCPDDRILLFLKLSGLRALGRRDDRLKLLAELCRSRDSDPAFWQLYGEELSQDARQRSQAVRYLRQAIRLRPAMGGLRILADILWQQRDFEKAVRFYRFAACMDDKDERLASTYFVASRQLKQTEEALEFLVNRVCWFGPRSSLPTRTLAWAYLQLNRTHDALAVLDRAVSANPDDGELMLFAADTCGSVGELDRAEDLLRQAKGRCRSATWLRTAANLAVSRGRLEDGLHMWQAVLETEPLAIDAHRALAVLLAMTQNRSAALEHLEQTARRFPENCSVHQLWIEWLAGVDLPKAEQVTRHLVSINSANVWAHRQLAIMLADMNRLNEAAAEACRAVELDPTDPCSVGLLGHVLRRKGQRTEALDKLRQAILLSVDMAPAIADLVASCETVEEKKQALTFIHEQLVRQTIYGSGLLAYCEASRGVLSPALLLTSLQEALAARPDLWQTWAAVVQQLMQLGRLCEAADMTAQATERFSLVSAIWQVRADVCEAAQQADAALDALERAYKLDSEASGLALRLAKVYETIRNDKDRARLLLERAVARSPLDARLHCSLADLLWNSGEQEVAVNRLEKALRLDSTAVEAWDRLVAWGAILQRPDAAADLARDMTKRREDEALSWLTLARVLSGPAHMQERLNALGKAESLAPHLTEIYELRAQVLVEAGRLGEALAACSPGCFRAHRPNVMRRLEAWVQTRSGKLQQSVGTLRELLKDDPTDRHAWSQLIDALEALSWFDDAQEAAERLVQIDPGHPVAYGYRGRVHVRRGLLDRAKADFRRALELDPSYLYAAWELLDVQIRAGEARDAQDTLALLGKQANGPLLVLRRLQIAMLLGHHSEALAKLRELSTSPFDNVWFSDTAMEALLPSGELGRDPGWRCSVRETFESIMADPKCNPLFGNTWIQQFGQRMSRRKLWKQLEAYRNVGPAGWVASEACIRQMSQPSMLHVLRKFVRRYGDSLKNRTHTWAIVGYALIEAGGNYSCAKWMADWTERQDAQPWMLVNIAVSLRRIGRDQEAHKVSLHALTLEPDYAVWNHQLMLALDEALAGQLSGAAERLKTLPDLSNEAPYYQFMRGAVRAILTANDPALKHEGLAFKKAAECLAAATRFLPRKRIRDLDRYHRRAVRRIARDIGGFRARLWWFGKLIVSRA